MKEIKPTKVVSKLYFNLIVLLTPIQAAKELLLIIELCGQVPIANFIN